MKPANAHGVLAKLATLALAFLLWTGSAHALTQPGGGTIPTAMGCNGGKPTGLPAVFACACNTPGVCNIGGPCPAPGMCDNGQHATCETTLFHNFNDNTCIPTNVTGLDPVAEASTTPETFHPTCALTFTMLSRGTARFQDAFGWYNVTGHAPTAADLHVMLDCHAQAGTAAVLDLASEPAWTGGEVAFFLLTPESHTKSGDCSNGDCCATVPRFAGGEGHAYFSQRSFNPDAMGASSYIHLLVYDSHVATQKFYFAWEDIFGGSNNDFTDLVTSVGGVECSGGGGSCDTGKPGACAAGVTTCAADALTCQEIVAPMAEVCNGVDDDCDGQIDNGATCPNPGELCINGRCTPNCVITHEFDCPTDLVCDGTQGRCVDPMCQGKTCPLGDICRAGNCVKPCDGISCPHGTACVDGQCIQRCDGVTCPAGDICREGVCLPGCNRCGGVGCQTGLTCDGTSGDCKDDSCAGGCPTGRYCDSGVCKDPCAGALCPSGQTCSNGRCNGPGAVGTPDAGPASGVPDAAFGGPVTSCGCRVGGQTRGPVGAAVVLLALGATLVARRRRGR